MANLKSSKKQAKKSEANRKRNAARKSSIKTSVKKLFTALSSSDVEQARSFLKEAEAKLARAKSKRVMHKNTASRKISRLAKRINKASEK